MGKFTYGLLANMMGMQDAFDYGAIAHTLGTNIRYEPDELNFFKERRDKSAKEAFHKRDEQFRGLSDKDARFAPPPEGKPETPKAD